MDIAPWRVRCLNGLANMVLDARRLAQDAKAFAGVTKKARGLSQPFCGGQIAASALSADRRALVS